MRGRAVLALLLVLAAAVPIATPASAATITVTTTEDELVTNGRCSLREAIRNANADAIVHPDCPAGSGADTITVPAGTYVLSILGPDEDAAATGDLDVRDSAGLTILGAGADLTIVQVGAPDPTTLVTDRVFDALPGARLTLSALTIRGGDPAVLRIPVDEGGGVRGTDAVVVVDRSTISRNRAGTAGGGVVASGHLTITNSTISDNVSAITQITYGVGGGCSPPGP